MAYSGSIITGGKQVVTGIFLEPAASVIIETNSSANLSAALDGLISEIYPEKTLHKFSIAASEKF